MLLILAQYDLLQEIGHSIEDLRDVMKQLDHDGEMLLKKLIIACCMGLLGKLYCACLVQILS